jgi:hypothetical protein
VLEPKQVGNNQNNLYKRASQGMCGRNFTTISYFILGFIRRFPTF